MKKLLMVMLVLGVVAIAVKAIMRRRTGIDDIEIFDDMPAIAEPTSPTVIDEVAEAPTDLAG